MTRFADPRRCPDCAHDIEYADTACPGCGLPLRGDVAAQLFQTLSTADRLLAMLRATVPATVPAVGPAAPHPGPVAAAPFATAPVEPGPLRSLPLSSLPPAPPRPGLSAASVPKILLGLGAACLLVAALVFLAVTWSVMGVGGRTATLVAFTLVTGGLAAWMARRDLRGAAEALSLVSLGLLSLDLVGARNAGWFGDIGSPSFLVVLGVVLAGAGVGASLAARRTPVGGLTGAEIVGAAGVALTAAGVATNEWPTDPVSLVLAVVVPGLATYALHRLGLRIATVLAGAVAVLAWFGQLGDALQAVEGAGFAQLWVELDAWQLVVSAALVGAVAAVRAVPLPGRVAAAAAAYAVLMLTAVLPAFDATATVIVLVALATLVVSGVICWALPRPWGLTTVVVQGVAGAVAVTATFAIAALAVQRLTEVVRAGWDGTVGGRLVHGWPAEMPAAWLAPLCVVAVIGTGLVLAKASPTLDRAVSAVTDLRVAVAVLAGSGVATLTAYPVPVWTVLLALLLVAGALLGWWVHRQAPATLSLSTAYLAAAVAVGLYDEWLTVVALTVVLLAAGLVHLRARQVDTSGVAGAVLAVALAGSTWTWGALVEGSAPWVALVGLLMLGATALTTHLYPEEWWSCEQAVPARTGFEAGAVASAVPLGLAGVLLASVPTQATWTAVYLTVAGAGVIAMSLLRPRRRWLAWPGGLLLAAASWVRLWDVGVRAPEAYTLPSALVLVALGYLHLRRDRGADTMTALGPGLTLALVPSLLWILAEPTGLRALLLGLACLALLVGGVGLRWTAPVVIGAAVGGVLVVRLAAPYIGDTVPRWVLIGTAGAVLIGMGVTWERRLQQARHLAGYMRSLR